MCSGENNEKDEANVLTTWTETNCDNDQHHYDYKVDTYNEVCQNRE